MYDNVKFKKLTEPFKNEHRHGGISPLFKLRSVTVSDLEHPPPESENNIIHIICQVCGEDLTHDRKESTIDLSEKYIPA